MREIKFRLYSKYYKRMFLFDPQWGNYSHGDGWVGAIPFEDGRVTYAPSNRQQLAPSDCEWMQFTGLIDRNSKEIYEGDIVRDCNGLDVTWVVEWCDKEACFLGLDWCGKPNEVIGNIYSNPELMEVK
uniref:Putative YopX protein n=1 Tax=viral metagenome TaxID=1070528 RepID=A0A6M3JLB5_9ZZZZ